jgi:multisubunit Na+/H+ antiporter MnhF subunit
MKKIEKIFAISMLILVTVAFASIPDKTDRILAFSVMGILLTVVLITLSWDWLKANWNDILFCLMIPVFAFLFLVQIVREKLQDYFKRSRELTPAEEYELMVNHFDEPLGI